MQVSSSLVLYKNPEPMLLALIESFEQSTVPCHLIVSDNSPNDDLKKLFMNRPWITYIHNKGRNDGFGAGHNIALQYLADSDYHIIVNPDISFGPDELQKMVFFMDAHPDIALLNPNVFYSNGKRQYLAKRYPSFFALFCRRFVPSWLAKSFHSYLDRYEMRDMGYDKVFDVPYLSGCFMFFRTKILKKLNGFDEGFFMYLEDADITLRASQFGRTVFFPGAKVIHQWQRGSYRSLRLTWVTIKSAFYLYRKHGFSFYKLRVENRVPNLDAP